MPIEIPPGSPTDHAVSAIKHLWMVPYTMLGKPDPKEGLTESIAADAQYTIRHWTNPSFWHFSASALAYVHIAASAVIKTLANHDNRAEVCGPDTDLINDELDTANQQVTMALADWFRGANYNHELGAVIHRVFSVADHPSGFDCTRNSSQTTSWFHCAVDVRQQAPCFNCPSVKKLGTLVCNSDMASSIDTILRLSEGQRYEADVEQLGPLPVPEAPATHCRHAVQHLAELAHNFDHGSVNHRSIAYAALAIGSAVEELRHLTVYVDMDEDTLDLRADVDCIAARILSGTPDNEDAHLDPPDEYDECILQRELTTGAAKYMCAPPDAPEDWTADDFGHETPCQICPLVSGLPERAMDRTLRLLAELPESR